MPEMMSLTSVCAPKPIGDADHAGAGDQRPDLDAQRRERHQHRHHRRARRTGCCAGSAAACGRPRRRASSGERSGRASAVAAGTDRRAELPVDRGARQLPEQIGHQQDDDRMHGAVQQAGGRGFCAGNRDHVEPQRRDQQP